MKPMMIGFAFLLLGPGTALYTAESNKARPNIVVILADDLGYADVGCQGAKDIPTPHIDRLASGGVRCTSGYVTWVACAPSRASILTGRDSHRFGFYTNPTPVLATDQGLPPGIMTIARALQQLGYVTGGIGKWHLGTTANRHPNRMGFSEWFGFLGGGHDYFPWEHYRRPIPKRPWPEWYVNQTLPILRNDQPVRVDRYLTDMFSDEAVTFIDRHQVEPFFLYLAYNAPHSPWETPKDEEAKLTLANMTTPSEVIPREKRRTYAAMVTRLDQGVGRVMAALRQHGLEENTLIFFLSDNGGGSNGTRGRPLYPSSNHPLRGFKGDLLEGGIRVPFIVAWKGKLPAGVPYDQPVSSLDMGATALALAGGAPKQMRLDGVNLIPHLSGQTRKSPHEHLFWKLHQRGAIREDRYKLITAEKNPRYELYDLLADVGETTNLAAGKKELVNRLDKMWQAWNAEMHPPLWKTPPAETWTNPEYQPPLWPEEKGAGIRKMN